MQPQSGDTGNDAAAWDGEEERETKRRSFSFKEQPWLVADRIDYLRHVARKATTLPSNRVHTLFPFYQRVLPAADASSSASTASKAGVDRYTTALDEPTFASLKSFARHCAPTELPLSTVVLATYPRHLFPSQVAGRASSALPVSWWELRTVGPVQRDHFGFAAKRTVLAEERCWSGLLHRGFAVAQHDQMEFWGGRRSNAVEGSYPLGRWDLAAPPMPRRFACETIVERRRDTHAAPEKNEEEGSDHADDRPSEEPTTGDAATRSAATNAFAEQAWAGRVKAVAGVEGALQGAAANHYVWQPPVPTVANRDWSATTLRPEAAAALRSRCLRLCCEVTSEQIQSTFDRSFGQLGFETSPLFVPAVNDTNTNTGASAATPSPRVPNKSEGSGDGLAATVAAVAADTRERLIERDYRTGLVELLGRLHGALHASDETERRDGLRTALHELLPLRRLLSSEPDQTQDEAEIHAAANARYEYTVFRQRHHQSLRDRLRPFVSVRARELSAAAKAIAAAAAGGGAAGAAAAELALSYPNSFFHVVLWHVESTRLAGLRGAAGDGGGTFLSLRSGTLFRIHIASGQYSMERAPNEARVRATATATSHRSLAAPRNAAAAVAAGSGGGDDDSAPPSGRGGASPSEEKPPTGPQSLWKTQLSSRAADDIAALLEARARAVKEAMDPFLVAWAAHEDALVALRTRVAAAAQRWDVSRRGPFPLALLAESLAGACSDAEPAAAAAARSGAGPQLPVPGAAPITVERENHPSLETLRATLQRAVADANAHRNANADKNVNANDSAIASLNSAGSIEEDTPRFPLRLPPLLELTARLAASGAHTTGDLFPAAGAALRTAGVPAEALPFLFLDPAAPGLDARPEACGGTGGGASIADSAARAAAAVASGSVVANVCRGAAAWALPGATTLRCVRDTVVPIPLRPEADTDHIQPLTLFGVVVRLPLNAACSAACVQHALAVASRRGVTTKRRVATGGRGERSSSSFVVPVGSVVVLTAVQTAADGAALAHWCAANDAAAHASGPNEPLVSASGIVLAPLQAFAGCHAGCREASDAARAASASVSEVTTLGVDIRRLRAARLFTADGRCRVLFGDGGLQCDLPTAAEAAAAFDAALESPLSSSLASGAAASKPGGGAAAVARAAFGAALASATLRRQQQTAPPPPLPSLEPYRVLRPGTPLFRSNGLVTFVPQHPLCGEGAAVRPLRPLQVLRCLKDEVFTRLSRVAFAGPGRR